MKKSWCIYLSMTISVIVCMILFDKLYLAAVLLIAVALPGCMFAILKKDVQNMKIKYSISKKCIAGRNNNVVISYDNNRHCMAAGLIDVNFVLINKLNGEKRHEEVSINIDSKKGELTIPLRMIYCGEVIFTTESIVCYDILGLTKISLPEVNNKKITVYPEKVQACISFSIDFNIDVEGENYVTGQKGMDNTEVFDMRHYNAGDDIRTIHWKLSRKYGQLFVKEHGNTVCTDLLILVDTKKQPDSDDKDKEIISMTMSMVKELSETLLDNGKQHFLAIPAKNGLSISKAACNSEHAAFIDLLMGVEISNKAGIGIDLFTAEKLQGRFAQIIYITNNKFPEQMYSLTSSAAVVAICITDNADRTKMAEKDNYHMIEIPYTLLRDNNYKLTI